MKKEDKVIQIIEKVCEEMCDNYCKYSEELKRYVLDDEEEPKCCENCPLNRLY